MSDKKMPPLPPSPMEKDGVPRSMADVPITQPIPGGIKADGSLDDEKGGHPDRTQVIPGVDPKPAVKHAYNSMDANMPASEKTYAPTEGIRVIAVRDGFYHGLRLKTGDRFNIGSMEDWGDWMKLADPKAEEARAKKQREEDKKKKDAAK